MRQKEEEREKPYSYQSFSCDGAGSVAAKGLRTNLSKQAFLHSDGWKHDTRDNCFSFARRCDEWASGEPLFDSDSTQSDLNKGLYSLHTK